MNKMESLIALLKMAFATIMIIVMPSVNILLILFLAHLVDLISAMMLNQRLRKYDPEKYEQVKLSSHGIGKLTKDFGFEVIVIFLIIMIEHTILGVGSNYVWQWVSYLMIGSQGISILENTSECNGARWSVILQKIFKSKASRYLQDKVGVDINNISNNE